MLKRIWMTVPCYYDFASFVELRRRAQDVVHQLLPDFELKTVLIDDTGGQDPELSHGISGFDTILLTVPYNLGHQNAIVFGLRKLAAQMDEHDFVVTLDCDGEDSPEDIPSLLKPLLLSPDNKFLVSIAQRTKRSEGALFKSMYACFRLFFQSLTGTVVRNGNFAAYRGWFVKNVLFHPYFDYCYSSSILALSKQIRGVPLARGVRYFGQSKMTLTSLISHGLRMLLPFSERIAVRSIIFACLLIGLVSSLCAFSFMGALAGYKYAMLIVALSIPILVMSVVVLAVSSVFFQTFNHARAMSLRYTTVSAPTEKATHAGEPESVRTPALTR